MQRKHFEMIAKIVYMNVKDKESVAESFAIALSGTNDRFDKERFINACLTGNMGKGRTK